MGNAVRLLIVGSVITLAVVTWWASFFYFRSEEVETASARLSLYRSSTLAELERFSHLTFVLSRDPFVAETANGGATEALDARLASFAARAGLDAIYLMDPKGLTISASNAGTPSSFVGQDYSFRPYFQTALSGAQGQFYGIGATTGLPGYFYAEAVTRGDGQIAGVIAIKIDLSPLQDSWRDAGEKVILANGDGVVLLSSEPDWRYQTLSELDPDQRRRIEATRQFSGQPLTALAWQPLENQTATIGDETQLHLIATDLPNDWVLHYFASPETAETRAWLVTGSLLLIAGAGLIAFQVQRTRRIRLALSLSEREEVALRQANDRLAVEIEDRRNAEARLQKTQAELERAGRLAALGQLSASVTHELGQPIAAMKNHLAAAELQGQPTKLTGKLQGLVDRMEGITRQLKFFARTGRDNMEDVDLADAMRVSLDLVQPNLDLGQIEVDFAPSNLSVVLKANRLRLEQVMTNLLRNAIDAVQGTDAPRIDILMGQKDGQPWFSVADNGHGLGDRQFEDLAEPFATTRESGKGMGLGLTISAGIVADHGGHMRAANREGGGAVFHVTFAKQDGARAA